MASERVTLAGTERGPPDLEAVGPVDPHALAQVSVYLKHTQAAATRSSSGEGPPSRESLARARAETLGPQMDAVAAFAAREGLRVVERDPARRLVKLEGAVGALERAFGAQLAMYDHPAGRFRARTGSLSAPADVAGAIEAVLGLDQRPVATAKSIRVAAPEAATGHLPSEIVRLYRFPGGATAGAGQCIGIIELGGGVSGADTQAAFQAMGLTPPTVAVVPVDGAAGKPGVDTDADGEVALDVQVAGAGAPGAKLAVYFAPNTDQGFVDAITQAAHDATHKPSVLSISWGSAESGWTAQAVAAMTSAFQDCATLGVSVYAASGDGLATDGVGDGAAHVDFPASSPWVVGCGGTRLDAAGGKITRETVWNSNGGGTGGGVSSLFPVPAYQSGLTLPPAPAGTGGGRGVPDVAGDADPSTGYRVIVDGQSQVIGGTSAVAPLWAGLTAAINAVAGKPIGDPHAMLYAHPAAFRDVVEGDNRAGGVGYQAAPGWDPCTGLGSPSGDKLVALFAPPASAKPA